jgi:hypothetical protein
MAMERSRGLKRRPLLRASSPLKPKINRELTLRLVQQTGALHCHGLLTVGTTAAFMTFLLVRLYVSAF